MRSALRLWCVAIAAGLVVGSWLVTLRGVENEGTGVWRDNMMREENQDEQPPAGSKVIKSPAIAEDAGSRVTTAMKPQVFQGLGNARHASPTKLVNLLTRDVQPPVYLSDAWLDYVWYQESRFGLDKRCRWIGLAGEMGEYQLTRAFVKEVERLGGGYVDVFDNESCRRAIRIWMGYWSPRVGAVTGEDCCQLFRRGASGYREWKGR